MNDYVERQWRTTYTEGSPATGGRMAAWLLATIVIVALAAYATRSYWYPYAAQWW